MGRKANPAVIGAFVVGAIALAVIGVLAFGSGALFRHTEKFICFFPGAVDGLSVGAPVKFKGVEIGSVTDIRLRFGAVEKLSAEAVSKGIRIPVMIEIDKDRLVGRGGRAEVMTSAGMSHLIDLGLRAQLNAQSLVTGLLFVQLNFQPDTPATFVLPRGSRPQEIPTVPTKLEQVQSAADRILRKLEEMHVEKLIQAATDAINGINQLANAPALKKTVDALPDTVANVNRAVKGLRDLTARIDAKQGPLFDSLKHTSDRAGAALEQAQQTLQSAQSVVNPGSPLASQLTATLQELSETARSVRLLADYLERNPSAIVRGRDVKE